MKALHTVMSSVVRKVMWRLSWLRWSRLCDLFFDVRYGVDTAGVIPVPSEFGPEHGSYSRYQGTPESAIDLVLSRIPESLENYDFVDFGCGKGKALLVAALRPFSAVVGVDFMAPLLEVAKENLKRFRRPLICQKIEFFAGDARDYNIPNSPLVIYLYNPFIGDVMRSVVMNIERSLRVAPRKIYICYYNPVCRRVFDESWAFTLADYIPRCAGRDDCCIYVSNPVGSCS